MAENADRDRSYSFFAKYSLSPLTITGAFGNRDKNIPTAAYGTIFNDNGTHNTDQHGYIDFKIETQHADYSFLSRLYADEYKYKGTFMYDLSSDGGGTRVLNRDDVTGRWWGGELQISRFFQQHSPDRRG